MIKNLHFLFASILMLAFGVKASAQDVVTFTFDQADSYEQFGLSGFTDSSTQNEGGLGDILNNVTSTQGSTTFTVTPSGGNPNRMWDSKGQYTLRVYGGKIIIASDKNIERIDFDFKTVGNMTASTGTYEGKIWTATDATNNVEFEITKKCFFKTVTVTLGEAGGSEPTPTEPVVILEESFAESLGAFTTEGASNYWSWNNGCAVMQGNGVGLEESTYLVSPTFKVGEQGTVSFSHFKNWDWTYNMDTKAGVYVRTVGGEWNKLEGVKYPVENKDFGGAVEEALVNIPADFNNKEIQLGFGYKPAAADQTTWSISNLVIKGMPSTEPAETVAENIAAFNALCTKDGVDVTLKLTDAKVLYVNEYESKGKKRQEIFVKDATGCVMFYNIGLTVKNGDVLNGEIKGTGKDFYDTKELVSNANTDVATVTVTEGALAEGEVKALNEITNNDISNLVTVIDVKLISKEEADSKGEMRTNYYMVDANGNEFAYYNKFHIKGLDANDLMGLENQIFTGIITLHYDVLKLCPIAEPIHTGIDCIENVELDVNAPMYNVAGQKVNANYKGIVLQNGKKFFNK